MGPNRVTGCHVTTILTSLSSEGTLLVNVSDQFLHLHTAFAWHPSRPNLALLPVKGIIQCRRDTESIVSVGEDFLAY